MIAEARPFSYLSGETGCTESLCAYLLQYIGNECKSLSGERTCERREQERVAVEKKKFSLMPLDKT